MKNIYLYVVALVMGALIAGCSDDENEDAGLLKVISTEASFDCTGGEGLIVVEAAGQPVTATSSEEWCTVQVQGCKLNLSAESNLGKSSRTAVISIKSGGESTRVVAYQLGDIFEALVENTDFTAKGGTVQFTVKSNWDVEIEVADESWLSYTYSAEEELLTVTAAPLEQGGKYRKNSIKLTAGPSERTCKFTQVNMAGQYACFVNGGNTTYGTCVLEETDTDFLYKVTPSGSYFDAPYYVKVRNGELVMYFGQYLGLYDYPEAPHAYLCGYCKQGYLIPSSSVEYVASLEAVNVNGDMLLIFGDNGTWAGYKTDGIYYGLYTNTLDQDGKYKNGIAALVDIIWVKTKE